MYTKSLRPQSRELKGSEWLHAKAFLFYWCNYLLFYYNFWICQMYPHDLPSVWIYNYSGITLRFKNKLIKYSGHLSWQLVFINSAKYCYLVLFSTEGVFKKQRAVGVSDIVIVHCYQSCRRINHTVLKRYYITNSFKAVYITQPMWSIYLQVNTTDTQNVEN